MRAGQGHRATLPRAILWLIMAGLLALIAAGAFAQEPSGASSPPRVDATGALVPNTGGRAPASGAMGPGLFEAGQGAQGAGLNYDEWSAMAARAEAMLAADLAEGKDLDDLRALLVDWREALLGAQSANSTRIAVIRAQIAALGPAPAEGLLEADEIAGRRGELADQLVRLQAPGIKADEAYEQADGLILEIDRLRRDRQAEEMLRLWPSPINPANWPAALSGLSLTALTLWNETAEKLPNAAAQRVFFNNLPLVVLLFAFAVAVLWRGRRWLDRLIEALPLPANRHAARVSLLLASIGQVVIPVAACVALTIALRRSGMVGPLGFALSGVISTGGFAIFFSIWLGKQLFAASSPLKDVADLSVDRWAEGRFLFLGCGLLMAVGRARGVIVAQLDLDESAASVTLFPILLFGGFILVRIGRLLAQMYAVGPEDEDEGATMRGIVRLFGKIATLVGVVGPLLAVIGYNSAAAAMIQPAAISFGLMGLLVLIQQLLFDLWALFTRQKPGETTALIPVLLSFALVLSALPAFALIWGADTADLTELWSRFQGGFTLGGTRISPTDFLLFLVIFAIGFMATRMLQGVLKSQILPRIGMDQGGRNAIAAGTGYVGIFLAALIAINAAGIDLSGLAIVAGALSVGIGFGLQAIVSNFVSGIILLIERPVSEGDWIEVGTVQGIVKSISVRSTRIQTFDRSDVIVPNQDLITGRVTNWTRFSLTGRIVVPVTVAFTSDSRQVARILEQIAHALPQVLQHPAPQVALMGFAADVMTFELRVILKDINMMVQARSDINHEILRRFRGEGIAFTNAHRDHLAKLAEAEEEERDLTLREAEVAAWIAEADPAPKAALKGPGAHAD
jgi:potassium efflux system protein